MNKITARYDFHLEPSAEEISVMLKESQEFDNPPATDLQVDRAVDTARVWLQGTTNTINKIFDFCVVDDTETGIVRVRYAEGEDLGFTCNNKGPNPFNTVYTNDGGPALNVLLEGPVKVSLKEWAMMPVAFQPTEKNILFESLFTSTKEEGFFLTVYLKPAKFYVRFFESSEQKK
ncbi:hypothetical protein COB55_02435 [Candidatus Wolfebacteria bacterium]|nr:MAG: hypothetical protein COB55_02435 [Candidatus Wolfebacteria bacterium]